MRNNHGSGWSGVPARYKMFVEESRAAAERRYAVYQQLAGIKVPAFEAAAESASADAKEK
jgi:hypothetical protein